MTNSLLGLNWDPVTGGGYSSRYTNSPTKAEFQKAAAELGLVSTVVEPYSEPVNGEPKIIEMLNRLVITAPEDVATFERAVGANYLAR